MTHHDSVYMTESPGRTDNSPQTTKNKKIKQKHSNENINEATPNERKKIDIMYCLLEINSGKLTLDGELFQVLMKR